MGANPWHVGGGAVFAQDAGTDKNQACDDERTALFVAAANDRQAAVSCLLQVGANTDQADNDGI